MIFNAFNLYSDRAEESSPSDAEVDDDDATVVQPRSKNSHSAACNGQ